MKVPILPDIHSNIFALEGIWAQESDSDTVYCTGDLVDYGSNPIEVLDWVREQGIACTPTRSFGNEPSPNGTVT